MEYSKKHSKFGFVSIVISICTLAYIAYMGYSLILCFKDLPNFTGRFSILGNINNKLNLIVLLMIVGISIGIFGLVEEQTKKKYSIIGIIMNALPSLVLLVFISVNYLFGNVSYTYKDQFQLPKGTSMETAGMIGNGLIKNGLFDKIAKRFPNFDLQNNQDTQGISLNWIKFTPDNNGEVRVYLSVTISSKKKLDNSKEIVEYSMNLIEEGVSEYFQRRNNF